MPTARALRPIAIGMGTLLLLAVAIPLSQRGEDAARAERPALESRPASQPERTAHGLAEPSAEPAAPTTPAIGAAPLWRDPFAPMLAGAWLENSERQSFRAQPWEPELAQALALKPDERLERRSGWYLLSGEGSRRVRVDRVYRLASTSAATATPVAPLPAPAEPPVDPFALEAGKTPVLAAPTAASATAPLDAAGGELVWSNAMMADRAMVQVAAGVTAPQLAASLPATARLLRPITTRGLHLVEIPRDGERSLERALLALRQLGGVVEYAEPDFLLTSADTTPDDPLFTTNTSELSKQWHLPRIMAPRAWDVVKAPKTTTIADQTVVAVVDTGVDFTHPDLATHRWTNVGETGGGKETNADDDDANGKDDDWRGWNFVENNNNPVDDVGHGTHIAGIIGAVGNNTTGASGVCWGVKILALRIIQAQGTGTYGTYSAAIAALDYLRVLNRTGRRVAIANHSWGGSGYSLAMLNAINNPVADTNDLPVGITGNFASDVNTVTVNGLAAQLARIKVGMTVAGTGIPAGTLATIVNGSTLTLSDYTTTTASGTALTFTNAILPQPYGVVHVAAAGNSRFNSDRIPTYPACLPSGFIVSVGATDASDAVAIWSGSTGSNFGRLNVDLFAPGSGIWSTKWKAPGDPTYGYESRNGTSMAAPQVAGAIALVRMWQPSLTELQSRQVLIEQVDRLPALSGQCVSGGRLNIAKVIDRLYQPILVGSSGGTGGSGDATSPLASAIGITGRIAAGDVTTLALRGGKVFAWGGNSNGQLGVSPTLVPESGTPQEVPGLSDVVMVATEAQTCFALKADGSVWAWGNDTYGQLGDGVKGGFHEVPTMVPGLADIIWISTGFQHALAVRSDGTLFVWGGNDFGQLGQGDTTERLVPVPVSALADIVMAEASDTHTIALDKDGHVHAWGKRNNGPATASANAIADGVSTGSRLTPFEIPDFTNVAQVAAGQVVSLALKQDGTVWQWGFFGNQSYSVPTQRAGLAGIAQIALSDSIALALSTDGRVYGWGNGASGQLGNRRFGLVQTFSEMLNPGGQAIVAVTASENNAYFIAADGSVFAAGSNSHGLLGIGTLSTKYYPVALLQPANIAHIGHGNTYNYGSAGFAADTSGVMYRWGGSADGYIAAPRATSFMAGAQEIKISPGLTLFRKADHSLWGWGGNGTGELGVGHQNPVTTPVQIPVGGAIADFSPGNWPYVSPNGAFSAAVLTDGRVQTWGNNTYGQLGTNNTNPSLSPVTVQNVPVAQRVATGAAHTLVLAGGNLWAWGNNSSGQLGDGGTTASLVPRQITSDGAFIAIAAIGHRSFALRNDGTVWSWGTHSGDPPGLGYISGTIVKTPRQVTGLPFISSFSIGYRGALMLANDGTVWAWGFDYPDVGRGPNPGNGTTLPGQVVGLSGIVQVTAGDGAYFARKSDGSWWVWGHGNSFLGDADAHYDEPIAVLGFAASSTTLSTLGTRDAADSWYFQNFSVAELLDDSLVGDQATPAGDGVPNLVKYALGLDPMVRADSASLPATRVDEIGATAQSTAGRGSIGLFSVPTAELLNGKRYLAFTVPRAGIHLDIDYVVEVSTDLATWRSGDPHTVSVLDTAETLEVYSAAALEDVPRQFMRLKIQRR